MPLRPKGRRKTAAPFLSHRKLLPWGAGVRLRRSKSLVAWVILLAVLILLTRLVGRWPWPANPVGPNDSSLVQVWRVIDGDTVELIDGTKVRLIGVDTPELARAGQPAEPLAQEAAQFTKQFLASGPVRLQMDPYERLDRYGRRLAYVWVADRMLNEELLLAGLARARLEFGYSETMKLRFAQAEQQAKQARRGLWALQPP